MAKTYRVNHDNPTFRHGDVMLRLFEVCNHSKVIFSYCRWGQCVLRTVLYAKDFAESNTDVNIAESHSVMAKQRRETLSDSYLVRI